MLKTRVSKTTSMSAAQVGPRLAESLLLHADKGRGLLLRLYHLKRELRDPGSDLYFLQDWCWVNSPIWEL